MNFLKCFTLKIKKKEDFHRDYTFHGALVAFQSLTLVWFNKILQIFTWWTLRPNPTYCISGYLTKLYEQTYSTYILGYWILSVCQSFLHINPRFIHQSIYTKITMAICESDKTWLALQSLFLQAQKFLNYRHMGADIKFILFLRV